MTVNALMLIIMKLKGPSPVRRATVLPSGRSIGFSIHPIIQSSHLAKLYT